MRYNATKMYAGITMKKLLLILALTILVDAKSSYTQNPQAKTFVNMMHGKYGFSKSYVSNLLDQAVHQQETLDRYTGRHKVGATDFSWHRYKSKILIPESIALGRSFMIQNKKWLKKAQRIYGVSPAIITAFIRVESKFGMYGSEYNVWNSLVTLSFNHNRKQKFFKGELKDLLLLSRKQHLDPLTLRGSFAGAMGCAQQVPSIQRRFGKDLDGDGVKNPNSIADCIGSLGAFLHKYKWNDTIPTVVRASYQGNRFTALKTGYRTRYSMNTIRSHGITPKQSFPYQKAYLVKVKDTNFDELYLGSNNYRIITRYNASSRYAITIALYAEAMKKEWATIE